MDLWKTSVKKDIEEMKGDIRRLQDKTLLQDQIIQNIQGDLKEIKEDTKWLKRTITNAIIMSVFTAIIGGGIAIIFTVFKGQRNKLLCRRTINAKWRQLPLLDAEGFHLLPYRVLNVEKNINFSHLSPCSWTSTRYPYKEGDYLEGAG